MDSMKPVLSDNKVFLPLSRFELSASIEVLFDGSLSFAGPGDKHDDWFCSKSVCLEGEEGEEDLFANDSFSFSLLSSFFELEGSGEEE